MVKKALKIELPGEPPLARPLLEACRALSPMDAAVFGGCLRDASIEALHQEPCPPKDYDLRLWFAPGFDAEDGWEAKWLSKISKAFGGAQVQIVPSKGTGRPRFVFEWRGVEVDASLREPSPGVSCAAMERSLDSDSSISSVALGLDGQAYCESLFLKSLRSKIAYYYKGEDSGRSRAYRDRMEEKFPFWRHEAAPGAKHEACRGAR